MLDGSGAVWTARSTAHANAVALVSADGTVLPCSFSMDTQTQSGSSFLKHQFLRRARVAALEYPPQIPPLNPDPRFPPGLPAEGALAVHTTVCAHRTTRRERFFPAPNHCQILSHSMGHNPIELDAVF